MKFTTQKGFTLAELLIVMAIIVILAAVAIPTFGRQMETARETGDMENIRNIYTEVLSVAIMDIADGKLDGAKNGTNIEAPTGWTITPAKTGDKNSNVGAIYSAQMPETDAIKSSGAFEYVNNTIAGKTVGTPAAKGNRIVNFRFKLDDGNLVLDDMTAAAGSNAAVGITVTAAATTT